MLLLELRQSYHMHGCPCGYFGDSLHDCSCTPNEIKRYTKKISGPLLDRIDIHIHVPRVEYSDLTVSKVSESSEQIRRRVEEARQVQRQRLKRYGVFCNAQMGHRQLKQTCVLTAGAEALLAQVFQKMGLSARSYGRIIKVSRTIADLEHADLIAERHIAEAIQLRSHG